MKIKRIVALVLAVMMMFGLAACGSSSSSSSDSSSSSSDSSSASTEESSTTTVKFGLITLHDENSTYDLNFINGFKEACDELGVEYVIKSNIPEGQECYEAACELADDEGCNIVFADSFGHEDYIMQAAKEYPDVQFCHATGTQAHTAGLDNYHNAFASIYEGRYLAGVAAGMKLNEMIEAGTITEDQAKMGYVGAYKYAEVISGYTSFYLGAKSVCPSVTMDVTFTESWYDETAEKEGANKLINEGCVLISQHADSMGAPTACEDAGVPDVSYNGSTESACPNTFIVSSRVNWAPYFKYVIQCVQNGEAIDADWTGDFNTDSVVLTDLGAVATAEGTAEKLEEVKASLESGETKVFDTSAFTVTVTDKKNTNATVDADGHLTSYLADVDDMGDYVGETEVVADGEFQESTFRSAPYFDVQIDGINDIDEQ